MTKFKKSILNFLQIATMLIGGITIFLAALFKLYIDANGPIAFFNPAKMVLLGSAILIIHVLLQPSNQ